MTPAPPIVVAGAGAIGCFVGGLLAVAGRNVTLLGRAPLLDQINDHGLHLTDFGGLDQRVAASGLTLAVDPACLSRAGIILVTVKTADTAAIAQTIARHAPKSAIVISLQNGMAASSTLRRILPGFDVRAGMVPFNVVPQGPAAFHRATSGDIVVEAGPGQVSATLTVTDLAVAERKDIAAVQWGKLLINLNNALNALSGMTLQAQLLSRPWRQIMAVQMTEALNVLRAHGIATVPSTPLPSRAIPWVLRLPTPVFSRVAARMLTIDPAARASMSYDLAAGKPTEIDALQGLIIAMGREKLVPTPLCEKVHHAVKLAEAAGQGVPTLSPSSLS